MDKKFKVFVIVSIVFLTLITVAGGVTVFFMMNGANKTASSEEKSSKQSMEIIHLAEPLNSNLKMDKDNIPHIVRIAVGFEIDNKDKNYKTFMENFNNKQIIIRDGIISLLRSQTYSEINKESLSNMIKEKVNSLLGTDIIQTVYFGDFFVQ